MILVFKRKFDFLNFKKIDMVRNATRNLLRVASLEERIEGVWSSETSKGVF